MVLSIYPPSALNVYKKIKLHYSPAVNATCDEIYKACVGVGTDEDALVKILGSKSAEDRAMIGYCYKERYNQTLKELIRGEVSGDFGYLMQMLCMSLPEVEAFTLYNAMIGVGTTDNLLYPILLGRSNEELGALKKAFFTMYEKDLGVMVDNEISGEYKTIIMTALQEVLIDYKSSFHTTKKAEDDAEIIFKAGEGKWGTDDNTIAKTLLAMPPQHMKNVDHAYKAKHGHGLVQALEAEYSGSSLESLSFFVRLSLEPWELIADHLMAAMAGLGTDDTKLSMLLVRYHPYLNKVKPVFEAKYKISLRERVHEDTGDKFRDLLLHVIDAPVSGAVA